jgi:hypothetical protein
LEENMEKTDLFIAYALKYRDNLIDRWIGQENSEVDEVKRRNELKNKFPFLKLLMIINRDIQFVMKEIVMKEKESTNIDINEMIYHYLDCMVYPVREDEKPWFCGYENFYDMNRGYRLRYSGGDISIHE